MICVNLYWNPLHQSTMATMKFTDENSISVLKDFIRGSVDLVNDYGTQYVIAHCNTGHLSGHTPTHITLYSGEYIARQCNGTYVKIRDMDMNNKYKDFKHIHTFIIRNRELENGCKVY